MRLAAATLLRAALRPAPLLSAAVLSAALLSACGGGGGGSAASVATTPSPPSTPIVAGTPGEYADSNAYSGAATGALAAPNEGAAVIASHIQLGGKQFNYTATTGHLNATDLKTGKPVASFFYVAYTAGGSSAAELAKRPVTFFYNGGPGSASMWLHLGSFGPRRLVSTIPSAVVPPIQIVDNQETLLERSDLVFVDAIGTGYTQAIAPASNLDYWGIDQDAAAFRDFVRRYLAVNQRSASPKFLFGESYGTPRSAVLANLLESAGVQVDAIVLQSAVMNYNVNCGLLDPGATGCDGYIPTYAATSAYHQRSNPVPATSELGAYLQQARSFADGAYRNAITAYLATKVAPPAGVIAQLVAYTGIPTLRWQQEPNLGPNSYQSAVLPGQLVGRYDARVSAPVGSALASGGDPSLAVINASFVSALASYMAGELHYSAKSTYVNSNDSTINRWNFSHDGKQLPDTIPDLAAALLQNPKMKVLAINGYHDLATPFHQTELDLARLGGNSGGGIVLKYYASGHMTYLDDVARRQQILDLNNFYDSVTTTH